MAIASGRAVEGDEQLSPEQQSIRKSAEAFVDAFDQGDAAAAAALWADTRTGIQIIGWDARKQAITSWTLGVNGGRGRGWWSRDGSQWFVQIEGVTPHGEQVLANNIFTVLDDHTFRWQPTDRSVAGVKREDTEPIRVSRMAADK